MPRPKKAKRELPSPKELAEKIRAITAQADAKRRNREDIRRNTDRGAFMRTRIGFPTR